MEQSQGHSVMIHSIPINHTGSIKVQHPDNLTEQLKITFFMLCICFLHDYKLSLIH